MLPFKYKSQGFTEYGIYVELYLPKHAEFQGTLYETLTNGFDHKKVKAHFLDQKKKPKIIELLQHHRYKQWINYTEKYVASLKSLYWGYSLYEVDGVFKPNKGKKNTEERTQVVRIMFLPTELDKRLEKIGIKLLSPEYIDYLDMVGTFLQTVGHKEDITAHSGREKKILQYVLDWYTAVGFFLIGYIVFEVCSKIEEVGDVKAGEYEKEVWLTSIWHFNINRFKFMGKPKTT